MIKYNFGIECELDWKKFLKIETYKNETFYKIDFKDFPSFYEYLEKNINDMKHLIFDGYEYFLKNGKLHNLYGAAKIVYRDESSMLPGTGYLFFINGKQISFNILIPCKSLKDFENEKIYYQTEISNKPNGRDKTTGIYYRRKEGVDFKRYYMNLEYLRKNEIRKEKIKKLL